MARERHHNLHSGFVAAIRPTSGMNKFSGPYEWWVYNEQDPRLYYASGYAINSRSARKQAERGLREALQRIDPEPREPRRDRPDRPGLIFQIVDRQGRTVVSGYETRKHAQRVADHLNANTAELENRFTVVQYDPSRRRLGYRG